jgi:hypothetical protein
MIASEVINALKSVASEERRKSNEWFFKTGEGQYGHDDQFIEYACQTCAKLPGNIIRKHL